MAAALGRRRCDVLVLLLDAGGDGRRVARLGRGATRSRRAGVRHALVPPARLILVVRVRALVEDAQSLSPLDERPLVLV